MPVRAGDSLASTRSQRPLLHRPGPSGRTATAARARGVVMRAATAPVMTSSTCLDGRSPAGSPARGSPVADPGTTYGRAVQVRVLSCEGESMRAEIVATTPHASALGLTLGRVVEFVPGVVAGLWR